MTNKEILTALKSKRDITAFARFMSVTVRTIYNILNSEKKRDNQYYNFIQFIKAQYLNK